jgi:hypothetical protein
MAKVQVRNSGYVLRQSLDTPIAPRCLQHPLWCLHLCIRTLCAPLADFHSNLPACRSDYIEATAWNGAAFTLGLPLCRLSDEIHRGPQAGAHAQSPARHARGERGCLRDNSESRRAFSGGRERLRLAPVMHECDASWNSNWGIQTESTAPPSPLGQRTWRMFRACFMTTK